MDKIRVLELFAGIGACSKALERLGIEHEIVDAVEIDKYAVKSFNAIHGTNFEPQDITKWNKDLECDLIMHGSPCQDFSIAGKQAGGDEGSGTRSSLVYETLRIVEKLKPKYVIWENVKNVLSEKHRHNFDTYQEAMKGLGYVNYYKVLNAKDYGVPQNRERVFTVSIKEDFAKEKYMRSATAMEIFEFPEPIPLDRRLKDMLEDNVDERYYLTDKRVNILMNAGGLSPTISTMQAGNRQPKVIECNKEPNHQQDFVQDSEGLCRTIPAGTHGSTPHLLKTMVRNQKVEDPFIVASSGRNQDSPSDRTTGAPTVQRLEPKFDGTSNTITSVQKDNYVAIKTANKTGYDLATNGDGVDLAYPESNTRRGRVGHGVAKTLPTSDSQGVLDGVRIRKLTPKECWRLMGFDDEDFEKAEKVNSNTQLYKQAGNSIVVNVLEAILKELLWK